jgi:hypothetical protein
VEVLELGPAERIDAVVTMNQPGVGTLGEVDGHIRNSGLGIVVEYAGRSGAPQWTPPGKSPWDYTIFGNDGNASGIEPDLKLVPLVFHRKFAGNRWVDNRTINGKSFPKTDTRPSE